MWFDLTLLVNWLTLRFVDSLRCCLGGFGVLLWIYLGLVVVCFG